MLDLEKLHATEVQAFQSMLEAADCLAFDMTIRAAQPHSPSHSPASPELTDRLKWTYLAAHHAHEAARAEFAVAGGLDALLVTREGTQGEHRG